MNREPQIQVFGIAHSDGSYIEVSNLGARWLSWVVSDGNGKYSDILLDTPLCWIICKMIAIWELLWVDLPIV